MTLQIKKISKSDIYIPDYNTEEDSNTELQRTEEWHLARNGSWSGSIIKGMMTCNAKGGKLKWNNLEKIFMFSEGIVKFIYTRAMQRKSNQWIESKPNLSMKYGTAVEPLISKIAAEELSHIGVFKEVGYKSFDDIPNAGASSDQVIMKEEKTVAIAEYKACVSWSSHYDRCNDNMNESSIDFWQTQVEMKAWNVDHGYYVVASPPKDISKYVYHEGDIFDLMEDFKKECFITISKIEKSQIHQEALIKRIEICEETCDVWIKEGGDLKEVFYEVLDKHKNNFNMNIEVIGSKTEIDVKEIAVEYKEVKATAVSKHDFKDLPF